MFKGIVQPKHLILSSFIHLRLCDSGSSTELLIIAYAAGSFSCSNNEYHYDSLHWPKVTVKTFIMLQKCTVTRNEVHIHKPTHCPSLPPHQQVYSTDVDYSSSCCNTNSLTHLRSCQHLMLSRAAHTDSNFITGGHSVGGSRRSYCLVL